MLTDDDREAGEPRSEPDRDLRHRLVGSFALDESDERFMERLNEHLAPFEEEAYADDVAERMPNLFVVGVPRSGTTLLVQLLASHLDVGWISNLGAAFWRAPCTGIRLHRRLLGDELSSSFSSRAGRTEAIAEPHEFGYFWTRLLGHGLAEPDEGAAVDWPAARRTLLHMNLAWDRPIVYKAFQLGYHIADTVAALPRSIFLHVRRDPTEAALSLLRTRVELTGSDEAWISLRPRGSMALQRLSPAEQVAGQILAIEATLEQELAGVPRANAVEIAHDELVDQPRDVLERVRLSIADQGCEVQLRGEPPASFTARDAAGRTLRRAEVEAAIERQRGAGQG